jgi:hypothetical protein
MRGQRIWPRGITVTTIANVSEEAELGSLFFQNAAYVGGAGDAFQIWAADLVRSRSGSADDHPGARAEIHRELLTKLEQECGDEFWVLGQA